MTTPTMPNQYPTTPVGPLAPAELVNALTAAGLTVDATDASRADHGRDWWPRTIPLVAAGHAPSWPGVVVYPRTTEDVAHVVSIARRHGVAVTPQGGRSGVVGGALPNDGAIALDLTNMSRIIDIDDVSGLCRVEAGLFGPDLEAALNERGLTCGHFPQSFDLATVGGWVACRGAGQLSNRYGKIEDIVRGVRVVTGTGEILDLGGHAPRQAVGPDLLELFVGSEGTLGIITEVTLVVRRRPTHSAGATYVFDSLAEGLEACRQLAQGDYNPAVARLYDSVESQRNFSLSGHALVVLDEGDRVEATLAEVARVAAALGARAVDDVSDHWLAHRNNVSSLTPLWEKGIVVDTIEVAGRWRGLAQMAEAVIGALTALPATRSASCHQSHAYVDGACVYFTFAGQPEGHLDEYYREAWDAATAVALAHGAALSHHHGVGRNRARFIPTALGGAVSALEAIKDVFDPDHILNPGVLGLGGAAWPAR